MKEPPRPETAHSRDAKFILAGRAGAAVLRALGRTWRYETRFPEEVESLLRESRPFIFSFFHESILAMAYHFRDRPITVLVSESRDGEYISQVIHNIGFGTIRGSSSRGGLKSLLRAARLGREGMTLGVTPDGPKGPRRTVQSGVLWMAAKSGRPVVPFAVGARPEKRLKSWDQFQIPGPFARVLLLAGKPLSVPAETNGAELESSFGPELQSRMDELSAEADRFGAGRGAGPRG